MNDLPFEWIPGEVVEQAYVEIGGVKYYVTPTQYADGTSLSAYHLNKSEYETIKRVNGTILWENPLPTSDFTEQDITLSSSDYDCYEVIYKQNTNTNRALNTGKIPKGYGAVLNEALTSSHYRAINYNSDTSLHISSGVNVAPYGNPVVADSQCVPLYIIGYKTGLFGGQS